MKPAVRSSPLSDSSYSTSARAMPRRIAPAWPVVPPPLAVTKMSKLSVFLVKIGRAHVELQSLMRISYAVFCLKKKKKRQRERNNTKTCKTYKLDNEHENKTNKK